MCPNNLPFLPWPREQRTVFARVRNKRPALTESGVINICTHLALERRRHNNVRELHQVTTKEVQIVRIFATDTRGVSAAGGIGVRRTNRYKFYRYILDMQCENESESEG